MVDFVHNYNLLNNEITGLMDDVDNPGNTVDGDNDIDGISSFSRLLRENIEEVNNLQQDADRITGDFLRGEIDNVHQVTIATEKARIAMELTLAIQNKVVDAYKEVMRMQV